MNVVLVAFTTYMQQPKRRLYEKCVRKMLMKLTADWKTGVRTEHFTVEIELMLVEKGQYIGSSNCINFRLIVLYVYLGHQVHKVLVIGTRTINETPSA